jgi:hypothetical protein
MLSDSRRNPRYRCALPAVVDGPRGALRGTCTNVSLEGLFFEGPSLAVGVTVSLTLDLGHRGKLRVQAQVRNQLPGGMGVQFTRFEPGQAEALQQLIVSLPK